MTTRSLHPTFLLALLLFLASSIGAFAQPTATIQVTDTVVCMGQSLTFWHTSSGPNPITSVFWDFDNGSTSTSDNVTFSYSSAGVYDVKLYVEDSIGARDTATILITVNGFTAFIQTTDVTCNGGSDGSATAIVNGGTPPYTYIWVALLPTQQNTFTNATAGNKVVQIIDGNNCSLIKNYTINQPSLLTVNTNVTPATCGNSDGTIEAIVTGGSPPYTYSWSNAAIGNTITGLSPGVYEVTVTDANGCITLTSDTVIGIFSQGPIPLDSINASACGASDGKAWVKDISQITTIPLVYTWSGGTPTAGLGDTITNLSPGTYYLTINDQSGVCYGYSEVHIQAAGNFSLSIDTIKKPCIQMDNGIAVMHVTGGTSPYNYQFSAPVSWAGYPIVNGDTISGLVPSTYNVTVTDANQCSSVLSFTLDAHNDTVFLDAYPTGCQGLIETVIHASASGGTPPYIYRQFYYNGAWTLYAEDSTGIFYGVPTLTPGLNVIDAVDAYGCSAWAAGNYVLPLYSSSNRGLLPTFASDTPSCPTCPDGSAVVDMGGGTPPYSYTWSGGTVAAPGDSVYDLLEGIYTVTVTDSNGCSDVGTLRLGSGCNFNISVAGISATCNGPDDGQIQIDSTGTYLPDEFSLDNVSWTTNRIIDSLAPGSYTLYARETAGCSDTFQVTVPAYIPLTVTWANHTDASCPTCADGNIDQTTFGGTPPYSYQWSNAQQTEDITGLLPGTYCFTITDDIGCQFDTCFSVGFTSCPVQISTFESPVQCFGDSTGIAWVTASSGTPPYSYNWSGGTPVGNGDTITNLAAGIYYVTVADDSLCYGIDSVRVYEAIPLVVTVDSVNNYCYGDSSGMAWVEAWGGTAPYTYTWSGGTPVGIGDTITNLAADIYYVTVTDSLGCSAEETVSISQPTALVATIDRQNASCPTCADGKAWVHASGGVALYTYMWPAGTPGISADTIVQLLLGTYCVTVTDANGCLADTCIYVGIGCGLSMNPGPTPTNVSCNGSVDGSITVHTIGGIAPVQFSLDSFSWQTNNVFTGLAAGTYLVYAADANNCTDVASVSITEPSPLSHYVSHTDASCATCADGEATAVVNGGTPPYTYAWSNGATTTTTIGLSPGQYFVTVTDANGCTALDDANIGVACNFQITAVPDSVSCHSLNDGSIIVTPTGGTAPYQYSIDNGTTWQSGNIFPNLTADVYVVYGQDSVGCMDIYTVIVGEPDTMIVNISTVDATCGSCPDGYATAHVSGGTPIPVIQGGPYLYNWTPVSIPNDSSTLPDLLPGSYTVTVADNNGCFGIGTANVGVGCNFQIAATPTDVNCYGGVDGMIIVTPTGNTGVVLYSLNNITWQTIPAFSGVPAGTYIVYADDTTSGCTQQFTVVVNEPDSLRVNGSIINPTCAQCNDGVITTAVTGGVAPYQYLWPTGGTTFAEDQLPAGNYCVTVTDANSCTVTDCFTLTSQCNLVLSASTADVNCFGQATGSINAVASGGQTPYQYSLDGVNWQSSGVFTGLTAGTYTVYCQDAVGCLEDISVTITEPNQLIITGFNRVNASCPTCADGSATVLVSGGVVNYSYLWSGTPPQTTAMASSLLPGNYSPTVTDANGCTVSSNVSVLVGCHLQVYATADSATCNGSSDGLIEAIASQGAAPYQYSLDNITWQSSGIFSAVAPGVYVVYAQDNAGCMANYSVVVEQPDTLSLQALVQNPTCPTCSDGALFVVPHGGTSPYTFSWDNGPTGANQINLPNGTYTITVTDAHGCTYDESYTLSDQCASINPVITEPTCYGDADGALWAIVAGVAGTYTVTWSDGLNTYNQDSLLNVSAGIYYITATNNSGCTVLDTFNLTQPGLLSLSMSETDASCGTCSDGVAWANVTGGTPPYQYIWSTGAASQVHGGLPPGWYHITVVDDNGCSVGDSVQVGPNCSLTAELPPDTTVCSGSLTLSVTLTNGNGPYSYEWSTNETTPTITASFSGTYGVTVTDGSGCMADDLMVIVFGNANFAAMDDTLICAGESVTLWASGGASYSWSPPVGLSSATIPNPIATPMVSTVYSVTITDTAGCSAILQVPVNVDNDCVWPGDANDDGITDNQDVLAIGVGYGQTGPLRPGASLTWTGQAAYDWNLYLANNADLKHVDCDGNGTIDMADTVAVSQNYNLVHLKQSPNGDKMVDPALRFVFPQDSVAAGETVDVGIFLGNDTLPVASAYGIAFSVNYDNSLVDTNTTHLRIDTSWLGTQGVDLFGFQKDLYPMSKVDVAITRFDQVNVGGFGAIGYLSLTMKDDISGKLPISALLELSFSGVKLIQADETELSVYYESNEILVYDPTSGYNLLLPGSINIYPNPVSDILTIDAGTNNLRKISLYNLLGEEVYAETYSGHELKTQIDISGIATGSYFISIETIQSHITQKLAITR